MKVHINEQIPHQHPFDSNHFQLLLVLSSLQKSEFLKLIISFFHYFWCQNWDQWHKMSGKNTHIYFFYFWFKNKRVWAEKIGKKRKKSKNLKVASNCPYIKFTQYIKYFTWKIKIISFKISEFCCFRPSILKRRKGQNVITAVFIVLWSCLFTTKLKSVICHNLGHSSSAADTIWHLEKSGCCQIGLNRKGEV